MPFDAKTNFARASVAAAPSPAASGTSLTVDTVALLPATPFNATIWPSGEVPLASNAEIVTVTAIVGTVLTIVRTQEGTTARTIVIGDQFVAGLTVKSLTDIENAIPSTAGLLSAVKVSAGASSANLSALTFSNSNGVSFGLSAGTLTGSVQTNYQAPGAYLTTAALSQDSSKYAGTNGAITGGSITVNTSGVSIDLPAYLTTAQPPGAYLTTARASNDAIGLNTAKSNVTWTVNSSGLSLDARGYAGTGTSATNASVTLNSLGLAISVADPSAGGNVSVQGSTGDISFSNSNNVSFGFNASTITATASFSQTVQTQNLHNVTLAGNTAGVLAQVSSGTLTIAGGNNITVSQAGNAITISGANAGGAQTGISGIVVSDATYSSGTVSFSGNNITIGSSVDGATQYIKLSGVAAQTVQTQNLVSVQGSTGDISFANSNGVTWGFDASTITASVETNYQSTGAYLTTQSGQGFSAANASSTFQTLVFQDSNGVSFSNNAGSLRVTHDLQFTSATSAITSAAVHTSAARIRAIIGSDATYTSGSVGFRDLNGITWQSTTGQSLQITHDLQYTSATSAITSAALHTSASRVFNVVAATNNTGGGTASLSSDVSFSAANGLTFYTSAGNAIVASHNALTTARASTDAIGLNTAQSNVTWTVNSSGLSLDARGYAGTVTGATGASLTVNSSGVSVNLPAYLTTADLSANSSKYAQEWLLTGNTAGTTSSAQGTRWYFSGGNSLTISGSSNSLVFSVGNYLTTARASTDAIGLNTAKTNVTWTVNSSGLSIDAGGYAGTVTGATGASITVNTSGVSINLPAYLTTADLSANSSKYAQEWLLTGNTAGTTSSAQGTRWYFSGGNSITVSGNSNSLVFSVGNYLTTARASTDAIGLNTAKTNVTWTVNSSGLSIDAGGYAGTVSGATGASVTVNTAGVSVNVPATISGYALGQTTGQSSSSTNGFSNLSFSGVGNVSLGYSAGALVISGGSAAVGAVTFSAGATSGGLGSVVFSNSNGVSFGLNVSTITATVSTYDTVGTATTVNSVASANSVGTVSRWAAEDHRHAGVGAIGISTSGNTAGTTGSVLGTYWIQGGNSITVSQITSNNGSHTLVLSAGAYITTARASTDAIGLNTANSNVTWTANSSGLSLDARGYAGTGTAATNASVTLNSGGISVNVPQTTQSYYANLDDMGGLATGASAITQTTGASLFIQPFVVRNPLSAGFVRLLASFNDNGVGTAGTTSNAQTYSAQRYTTVGMVIYTQGVGASSRSIQSLTSTSAGITGITAYGGGANGSRYTMTLSKIWAATGGALQTYTTSYPVSSASIVISSDSNTLFTGPRFLDISWAGSLGPGNYWLGIGQSTSSSSNSSHISFCGTIPMLISLNGISQTALSFGLLGAVTSASDHQLQPGLGVWTTNANIFSKDSIALSQVSQVASNPQLPFQIIRSA